MSIASRIQEMETHINNAYTSIDNLGIDISNTNKNIYNISTLLDTFYESLPKVSGIGASLSLSPSLRGKIKLNELQGNTLQENTPTPSSPVPIESVTGLQNVTISNSDNTDSNTYEVNLGKNLIPSISSSQELNGITFTLNEDKSITLNGTATSNAYINIYGEWSGTTIYQPLDNSKYYTISGSTNNNIQIFIRTTNGSTISSHNPQSNPTFTGQTGIVNYFIQVVSGTTCDNVTIYPQLEKGSQATTYSPYFTPIELNKIGDYEDSIKKSTGKNLFDKDNANTLNSIINGNNGTLSAFDTCRTIYIPCKPNTTYAVSRISGTRFVVGTTTNQPTIGMVCNSFIGNNTASSIRITTGANDNYLCVFYYNSGSDTLTEQAIRDTLMIQEGSIVSPYEPYGKVWYVEKKIPKVVLTGANSEDWALATTYTNNTRFTGNGIILGTTTSLMSDYFVEGTGGTDTTNIDTNGSTGKLMITIPNSIATTVSQLTTWLSTHNVEVLYQLATPIYEVITNTELIEQLETLNNAKSEDGTTNINVTSEDLSMILNVGVLKGE